MTSSVKCDVQCADTSVLLQMSLFRLSKGSSKRQQYLDGVYIFQFAGKVSRNSSSDCSPVLALNYVTLIS